MNTDKLQYIIKNSKNILLVSHINPDGDTLGSMCGFYNLIKDNFKKKCQMAVVSDVPSNFLFLPGIENAQSIKEFDNSREYDAVICIDVAALDRIADAETLFHKAKNTVNIDHHGTNTNYADINIIDANAAAASEVVINLSKQLDWTISLDSAICLYTALMTDTGCFRFSNTTPQTMNYAGEMLSLGVDSSDIYQKCYESHSKEMILFQSYCLGKADFLNNDKIAYTTVYKKDLEKFNHKEGDDFTDGLTEKLRSIKTTEIAFVIKELSPSMSKLSMRSKEKDISKVCTYFGGGGHKLASGAVIKADVKQSVKMVLGEIKRQGLC